MAKALLRDLVPQAQKKKLDAVHGTDYEFEQFQLGVNQGTHGQMYGEGVYASNADEIGGVYASRDPDHEEWMYSQYKFAESKEDYYMMDAWERAMSHETPWSMRELAEDPDIDEFTKQAYLEVAQSLSDNPPKVGHMLRLEIDADVGELLNWDAPLSEQPAFIQEAAKSLNLDSLQREPKGKDIYYRMVDADTPAQEAPTKIREALQEIGAKGITYKEPNSATAQNYVIFDPDIIKIAERYAMPVAFVSAGMLQAEQADAGIKFPSTVYRPGQEPFDPRFDIRAKEQDRLAGTAVDLLPVTDTENVPTLKLSDLEGESFVTSMSDRTAAGDFITGIDGVQLPQPVRRRGGQDFMLENPGQVWASALTPSKAIVQTAQELRDQTGKDPLYMPFRMAPTGGDFAVETGETMLGYAAANMNKTQKRSLDAAIRKFKTVGTMKKGKRVGAGLTIKDWFGVDDPRSIDAWRSAPDTLRKELMNMMDVRFRGKGGLSRGQARLAVTDHRQLSARDAGLQNVGRVTQGDVVASSHPSYPFAAPGEFVGRLEGAEDATAFDLLPDARFGKAQRKVKDPANPTAREIRALTMKPYAGQITEKTLRDMEKRGIDVRSIAPAAVATGAVAATSESQAAFAEKRDQKNTAWTQLKDAVGGLDPSFKQLSQLLSDTAKTNPMLSGQREIGGFLANSLAGMGSGFMGAAAYNEADPSAMDYFSGEQIEGARDFVRNIPQAIGLGSMEENLINQALMDAMQGVGDVVSDTAAYQAFVEPALQDIAPDAMEFYEGLDPRVQGQLSGIFEYIGNAIR